MALIYKVTMSPTKLELLAGWLPGRPWFSGAPELHQVGAYRFDDPAGEVGVETLLLRSADGTVLQVPLTYRGAPVDGAERYLVGTAEHPALGRRWVYDGCGDPVWAATLAAAMLTGDGQAQEFVDAGGEAPVPRASTVTVRGSGTPGTPVPAVGPLGYQDEGPVSRVGAGTFELVVVRTVGTVPPATDQTLIGRWDGGEPVVLAGITVTA